MIKESVLAQRQKQPNENSRSISLRLKENDLAVLNHRFKLDDFENLSDLVRSYLDGEITKSAKPDLLSRLLLRLKEKNITIE